MRVCLFEHRVETLDSIVLTRPVFDLRCGLRTIGEKLRLVVLPESWSAWVRPELAELTSQWHPDIPINDATADASLWINSRWLPPAGCTISDDEPRVGIVDGDIAWIASPSGRDLESVLGE